MIFNGIILNVIPRPRALERIIKTLSLHPVAALLGPRQCGKTTLAKLIAEREPSTYYDLENPVDISRLSAPMRALEKLSDLVIIDEVQRRPDLFELLRVLVDRPNSSARFLLLGSASPHLAKGAIRNTSLTTRSQSSPSPPSHTLQIPCANAHAVRHEDRVRSKIISNQ